MKIATRASKLAMAQSTIVVETLKKIYPQMDFELVPIVTTGDKNIQKALQNMEGKDFFVKELDDALIQGFVDASIHSFKDLSLERPKEITLAAVPERSFLQDIVFFNPESAQSIRSGKPIKIKVGSSAPRRKELLLPFLRSYLPLHPDSQIDIVDLRGNIDTRLSKIKSSTEQKFSSELDAVVLAMAGIERLFGSPYIDKMTDEILKSYPFVLVPIEECPGAPAQGALAIECRHGDEATKKILNAIHHEDSLLAVKEERAVLKSWGGGCHLALGASLVQYPNNNNILYIKGRHPNGSFVQEKKLARSNDFWGKCLTQRLKKTDSVLNVFWNGREVQPKRREGLYAHIEVKELEVVFLSHPFLMEVGTVSSALKNHKGLIFAAGLSTWREAVKKGVWVSGSSESRGVENFRNVLLRARFFRGRGALEWVNLTHGGVEERENGFRNIACYEAQFDFSEQEFSALKKELARATHIFWASSKQFELLHQWASSNAIHASRPGRTFDVVSAVYPERSIAVPDMEEWKTWIHRT